MIDSTQKRLTQKPMDHVPLERPASGRRSDLASSPNTAQSTHAAQSPFPAQSTLGLSAQGSQDPASLIQARLVFNAITQSWNLCESTGSVSGAGQAARRSIADLFATQTETFGPGLSAAQPLLQMPQSGSRYRFGRLGYYARAEEARQAKAGVKAGVTGLSLSAGLGLMVMSTTALVNPAIAGNILPTGGTVNTGSGSIAVTNGGAGLQITQNTQVLGLRWTSFSIGAGNSVVFKQPDASSVAVNRVTGNSRSEIYGSLQANGQVFLLNPNGVLIARTAQIDTGAFVAAAASDAQRDAKGNWTLSGMSDASVINQGTIRANGQGGFVVLAGAQVSNEGSLSASAGVALAAAETVSLALDNKQMLTVSVTGAKLKALVQNKGLIIADGGAVYLTAAGRDTLLGTVVNNEGIIQARGLVNKQGRIILSGLGGDVVNTGTLDVSGKVKGAKGGLVVLNGNRVAVAGNSVIDASGDAAGGRVIIGGDQLGKATDVVNVTLSDNTVVGANAFINVGSASGDGGFVETSGHQLTMLGQVAGSSAGKAGEWLIDPNDVTINTATNANMGSGPSLFAPSGSGAGIVNNSSIENALIAGLNVTVTTNGSGTGSGNITWNAGDINKSAGGNATLTLLANGSISLSGITITSSAASLNVNLAAAQGGGDGAVNFSNVSITTNNGNLTASGSSASQTAVNISGNNTLTVGTGTGQLTGVASGSNSNYGVAVQSNATLTTSGNVTFNGSSTSSSNSSHALVFLGNNTLNSTSGTLKFNGQAGNAAAVYFTDNVSLLTSGSGVINVTATGASTGATHALYLTGNVTLADAGGGINLNATVGGSSTAAAIALLGNTSTSGAVTMTGTATSSNSNSAGLSFASNSSLNASSGTLNLTATATNGTAVVIVNSTLTASGSSVINLNASEGVNAGNASAVNIGGNVTLNATAAGAISINGSLGGSSLGYGLSLADGALINSFGNVTISGISTSSSNTSHGLVFAGNNTLNSTGGTLKVIGQTGNASAVYFSATTSLLTSGSGVINVTATGASTGTSHALYLGNNLTFNGSGGGINLNATLGGTSSGVAIAIAGNVSTSGTVTMVGNTTSNSSNSAGIYLFSNSNLNATGGTLNVTATAANSTAAYLVNTSIMASGTSVINLTASESTNAGNYSAISIGGNVTLNATATGTIGINGSLGGASTGYGLSFADGTNVTGFGNVTLGGTSTSSVSTSHGVVFVGNNTLNSTGGTLKVTGQSGNASAVAFSDNKNSSFGTSGSGVINLTAIGASAGTAHAIYLGGNLTFNGSGGGINLNSTVGGTIAASAIAIVGNVTTNGTVTMAGTTTSSNTSSGALYFNTNSIVTTTGGTFNLTGNSANTTAVVISNNQFIASGTGVINLTASESGAAGSATAVSIGGNLTLNATASGAISLGGTVGGASTGYGLSLGLNTSINSFGNTTISGSSTSSANTSHGLVLSGNNSFNSPSGTLKLVGQSANASAVYFSANTSLQTSGTGVINVTGTGATSGTQHALFLGGTTTLADAGGGINLNGSVSGTSTGAGISFSGNINTSGAVTMTGRSTSNGAGGGLSLGASTLNATSGTLNLTASSTNGPASYINGASLGASGAAVINLTATETVNGSGGNAISWGSTNTLNASGTGNITIAGIVNGTTGFAYNGMGFTANTVVNTYGNVTISGSSSLSSASSSGISSANAVTINANNKTLTMIGSTVNGSSGITLTNNVLFTGSGNLTLAGGSGNITLSNSSNNISGTITVLNGTNVNITKANAFNLGNVTASASLRLDSSSGNGSISQGAGTNLSVGGTTTLLAGTGNITLANSNNLLTGQVSVTNATAVTLVNNMAMNLGAVSAAGDVNLSTKTGNLTLNGNAATSNGNITLAAGTDSAVAATSVLNGNVTGGDVVKGTATSLSATNGTVTIYSGNANTSNLSGLVTNGTVRQNKKYATAAYTATVNSSSALNVFYRVSPTVNMTGASATSRVYDGTTVVAIGGSNVTGAIDGDVVSGSTLQANFADKNVGTNKTIITSGSNVSLNTGSSTLLVSGYQFSTTPTLTANVTKANLTVTANSSSVTYNGSNQSVSGFTATGLVGGETIAVLTGVTATGATAKNAGVYNNTVSGTDTNYNMTFVNGSLNISKANATVTANSSNVTYNGATQSVTTFTATGLVGSETAAVLTGVSVTGSGKNAGNYTTSASGTDANYNLTFVNGSLNIAKANATVTANSSNVTYNGANQSVSTFTATGLVGGETAAVLTGVSVTGSGKNAGNYTTSASGTDTNYNLTFVNGTLNIAKANLTITATNQTKTYDGSVNVSNTSGFITTGLVSGENVSVTLAYTDKNAGSNKTVTVTNAVAGANTSLSNYNTPVYVNNTNSTITQATITAITNVTLSDKVYDGTTNASFNVSNATFTGKIGGDNLTLTGGTGGFATKNAGSNISVSVTNLSLGGTDASNYIFTGGSPSFNGTANITKANLTVTATNQTKTYDGSLNVSNASGFIASGLVSGESIASVTLAYTDKNAGIGNKTVAVSNAVAGANTSLSNYNNITYVNNATSTINQANLTITATNQTKTYDGSVNVSNTSGFITTGLVSGENVSVTLAYTDKNAGSNKTVTVTNAVAGANTSLSNYNTPVYVNNTNSTITQATITAITNVTLSDKVYDGTTNASFNVSNATFTGKIGGDNLTLTGGTGGFATKNAGSNISVSVTNLSLGGTDAGNYVVTGGSPSFNGTANITQANVTLTTNSSTVAYNGSVQTVSGFTVTSGTLYGTDASSFSATVNGTNAGTYNNTLSGTNSNYNVTVNQGVLNITKANVTLTTNSSTVTYNGGVQTVSGYTVTSGTLYGTDASSFSATVNGTNAGTYNNTLSGTNNNYNVTTNQGVLTINKANLTVIANNDAKIVTQADNASYGGISYSGFVGGQNVSTSGVTGGVVTRTNANESAGTYNGVLVVSGVTSNNYNITTVAGNYTIVPADKLLIHVSAANTTYGTGANYTISSAQYLNSNNSVIYNLTQVSNSNSTYTYSDGVGGQATFTVVPQNTSVAGSGSLVVGHYNLTMVNTSIVGNNFNSTSLVGALDVNQKAVSISSVTPSKTYDGTTSIANASVTVTGIVSGDSVSVQANGSYASKNAGSNLNYTLTSSAVSGADSANYYVNPLNIPYSGSNGIITKANATLTANSSTVTYNGANQSVSGFTVTGLVNGETASVLTGVTATGATAKNAGTYNNTVSGSDGNYNLAFTNGTLTINRALISSVSNITALNKTYDGTTAATLNSSTAGFNGLIAGDQLTVANATGSFADAAIGTSKLVTISNIALGGSSAGNYQLVNTTATTTADIVGNSTTVVPPTVTSIRGTASYKGLVSSILSQSLTNAGSPDTSAEERNGVPLNSRTSQLFVYEELTHNKDTNKTISIVSRGVNTK